MIMTSHNGPQASRSGMKMETFGFSFAEDGAAFVPKEILGEARGLNQHGVLLDLSLASIMGCWYWCWHCWCWYW